MQPYLQTLPDSLAALQGLESLTVALSKCPPVASQLSGLTLVRVYCVGSFQEAAKWRTALGGDSRNRGLKLLTILQHPGPDGQPVREEWQL